MILFWILFVLIILISLILAYLSMRDFEESSDQSQNDLFLLRNTHTFNIRFLNFLHEMGEKEGAIFAVERLFKGSESALLLYGPSNLLRSSPAKQHLVELEEYANFYGSTSCFELGVRGKWGLFFEHFPKLEKNEQIWWQLTLQPLRGKPGNFRGQIRAVVLSADLLRRRKLSEALRNIKGLIRIPRPFSQLKINDFYKKRSIVGQKVINLTSEEIVSAFSLPKAF